jgi:hypothetical protein
MSFSIMRIGKTGIAAALLLAAAVAQEPNDPFPREGTPAKRAKKDVLEGKAPPALIVGGWRNTERPIVLAGLRGKVVLLDFWGVW